MLYLYLAIAVVLIVIIVKFYNANGKEEKIKSEKKHTELYGYELLNKLSFIINNKTRNIPLGKSDKLYRQSLFFREYLIWYIHKILDNDKFMSFLLNNKQVHDPDPIRRCRREMKNIVKSLNYICIEKIKITNNIKVLSMKYANILKRL